MTGGDIRNGPVQPNLTNPAWEVGIKFYERMLVQVTTRNTSDKDSAGLSRRGVVFTDKVLLTERNEVGHFAFNEVPDPD